MDTRISRNHLPREIQERNTPGRGSSQYKDPQGGKGSMSPGTGRGSCDGSSENKGRCEKVRRTDHAGPCRLKQGLQVSLQDEQKAMEG